MYVYFLEMLFVVAYSKNNCFQSYIDFLALMFKYSSAKPDFSM